MLIGYGSRIVTGCDRSTMGCMSAYVPELDRIRLPQASVARVLSVCFEPTNQCPGKFPYCLIEKHDDDQTAEVLRLVIDRLLDHGTLRVGFGGGEPLVRGRGSRHRGHDRRLGQ
jgi:hypothetical protein